MVSFSQLPAVKKDTIFGAARKFLGPSYFVTALVHTTKKVAWKPQNSLTASPNVQVYYKIG